jgi:hypothetical protein
MSRKFPFWLTDVEPGEPAHGALLRIAALNGFSVTDAITTLGGDAAKLYSAKTTECILREIGPALSATVQLSTPSYSGRKHIYVNNERLFQVRHWHLSTRRRCPKCLADLPYHRIWWDCKALTTCPIHAIELEDRCAFEGCGCKITWTSGGLLICRNGHDLRFGSRPAPISEITCDAYIAGRLGFPDKRSVSFLDSSPLDEVIELIEGVGLAAIGGYRSRKPTIQSLGVPYRTVMLRGFQVLCDGELSFKILLDQIAQVSSSRTFASRYGWLYQSIRSRPDSNLRTDLLSQFNSHARGHIPTAATDDPFLTAKQAAQELNVSSRRVQRILTAKGFLSAPRGNSRFLGIKREHVSVAHDLLTSGHSLKDTARHLRERRQILGQLISAGLLPTALRSGTARCGSHIIERSEVDALVDRLTQGVQEISSVAPGSTVLRKLVPATNMKYSEILRLVLEGKLKPEGRLAGAAPLSGLVFNIKRTQAAYIADTRTALTQEAAAKELGIKFEELCSLIRGKHIEGEWRVESKRRYFAIAQSEIDRFKSEYATASEFAQDLQTSETRAWLRLIQLGLKPKISVNKRNRLFFSRVEVETRLAHFAKIPSSSDVRRQFWLGLSKTLNDSSLRMPDWFLNSSNNCNLEFSSGVTDVTVGIFLDGKTGQVRVGLRVKPRATREFGSFIAMQVGKVSEECGVKLRIESSGTGRGRKFLGECPCGSLFDQAAWKSIYAWLRKAFLKLLPSFRNLLKDRRYLPRPAVLGQA